MTPATSPKPPPLYTPSEMNEADRLTIAAGTPGYELMKRAGAEAARIILPRFPDRGPVHILCGPGNNGGDGFVIARHFQDAGRRTHVHCLCVPDQLSGDAALALRDWEGGIEPFGEAQASDAALIIDCLFGAGLSRPISGEAAAWVAFANAADCPVIAIDLPSGIDGRTGKVLGAAITADLSITFHARKAGHLLYPGRAHCGEVVVADIGLASDTADRIGIQTWENTPALWRDAFPQLTTDGHKFDRGHALVLSGGEFSTGASRLTAGAALRIGAGLVSLGGDEAALRIHAAHVTAIMLKPAATPEALGGLLKDPRINTIAAGPGFGIRTERRALLDIALNSDRRLVLDADAISMFAGEPDALFDRLKAAGEWAVMTPHAGEFSRLFGDPSPEMSKTDMASDAA